MKTLQTLFIGLRKAMPAALLLCVVFAANAQVRIPFTQRTSAFSPTQTIYSINGDFTMIGNTNLTLQNYSATELNSNRTMIRVDADGIATTNNSSSSTLTFSTENGANPTCSRVLFAGLYWSARTNATPTELQKRTIKFRGPGQTDYTTYTASPNNIRYPGDNDMYASFVEVTSQVQQLGAGQYWAADMALTTGDGGSTGYYGGWGLVVVYENSKMQKRDVTLFDGYAYVVGGTAQWELPVSGFTSALSGAVNTKLGMMAGEGDVTITGDKFEIQKLNSTNWELLSHGGNSTNNFFNSSIFTGGNTRNPNLVNNTGMDISMFNIPNASNSVIGNGQTSTKFRYSSTQDTYIIYSICMAVDAYEPVVEGFLSTLSVNNIPTTSEDITVLPGDEIKYKIQIRNKGNEAVNNARIEIPLPYAAITYQGSSVNVFSPASSSATPYVDASLGANGTLVWDFGTLPLPSDPNTVLGEIIFTLKASEDCELYRNFNCSAPSVQIDGTISGIGANTQISVDDQPFYVGFSNVDGCSTEPLLGPFNIDINSANWVTANCPVSDGVRDFTYCNRTVAIPVTDVLGFYPAGTRFFNANQTVEYTVANPFPNQAGPITYRALLPGSSCVLSFTISITNISSVPTVAGGTTEYCRNDAAVALSATPSNPSYQLFYFAPSSTIAQPLLIPSTAAAGNFVYQVAEGPSSTCISTARVTIPVQINALPTITVTPTQIVCFGATGSVELAANGGTGALTFASSNPAITALTAGSYTYEISDSKGCNASATAVINAAPAQPSQPSLACYQTANWNIATCSWDVTGTQPAAPETACYENASFNASTCSWDVTGTQPEAPATACYENASFNASTCSWDVTGTQPAAPATACYENASFNVSTCSWDVTGTQPERPTTACYENASFNISTCSWDVTGTQPEAPATACYETATFNTSTCGWDVTGTQPSAPTTACYETATFNTSTCGWDVTGTQTPAPTTACYETATFNTLTCGWDVTGTQPSAPTTACYETATFNTLTCGWDVTGTQPSAPTTACYETATFNTTSCAWDVTGTQAPAPTTACYETATFNTTSCSWDVTGTQAPAPTNLSCWQTATFNTTSCAWDVKGTQAPAPTNLSCWETATFNTTSCGWDVTGTQAPAPTNLSCWQTATFNTTSCAWDVTGTQPTQPTNLACYQTATFNTASCSWVVSGTPAPAIVTNASACGSYTWTVNNQQYTASGSYTFTANCQDYTLNLTVTPAVNDTLVVSACDNYNWNGSVYTQSGTYTLSANCDNACVAVQTSPFSCSGSGYTSTITTNSDVNVGPGQTVRISTASFNKNLNISGGTLVICGSAAPQNINMNTNGAAFTLVVNGSLLLNNLNLPTNAVIKNYGSLTLNNSVGFSGEIQNYGSMTCSADFNVNSGGKFYNYATASVNNHNNSNISENRGTLAIGNRLQNNGGASFKNTCTLNVGNEFINNSSVVNEGSVVIQQMLRLNGGSTFENAAGKTVSTKNLILDGTFRGVGSGLSRLSVSMSSLINASGRLEGTTSLCDANGVETNNGQAIAPAFIGCSGNVSAASCCNTSTLVLTIAPSASNTTTVSACESYTWVANGTTYTSSGVYSKVTGCNTEILNLAITPRPQQPSIACYQTATFNTTTCSWDITGTQPAQPTNLSCWQTATFNTTSCAWDVTGTQAPAPSNLSCWETAAFNTTSCAWDVTGTQAPAPTNLSCWQTATFNTTSCSWDVTGTQAPAPTNLSCWQTATFNTTSCAWDVTGTQAPAPTNLSCWETATFNTGTCSWDVTGTQAPAPTNLSCWQTATFNTGTCSWDVTGTQAPAPTNLSCWETATFNTTSCGWDVTGTQAPAPTNISCWQSANFNTNTCSWDVTGTQAPAPIGLECYQTATFNNASCSWVVSGTPSTPVVTNASACGSYTWSVNGQTYTQSGTYDFSAGCVNSTLHLSITAATTAGQISGPSNSCAHQGTSGTNATYSVQATNATSYVWNLPSGATNISGQGTASISFRFSSTFNSGNVSVVVSGCGTPITRSISVTRTAPATPGAITGTVNVCAFRGTNTPVTYSIAAVANAASYTWTLPSGVTLLSGSGTTTIQVLIGSSFCGGNITVRSNSACGNSSTRCLALNVSTPSTPVSISGLTTACPGNSQTYSTAAVNNATSYNWTLPTGASITSGAGTNTITVSFGAAFCGGTLSVHAVNGCGQSSARSITINRNVPATPAAINGPTTNLCGTGTYSYSIAAVSGATSYTWTVPTGASIVSNNGTSINVNFTNSFSSGFITVKAVNACGSGTARSITLSRLPSTPASIAGPTTVCRNQQGVVYSTPVISGLTYTWTVPNGAVITAGQGTASVTVKFGTSNGNVTVRANNGCGSSTTRSLAVCVASCRLGETEPEEVFTEAVSAFEFVVYPNPGIGRLNISMPELSEKIQLRVFAANGTLVRYEQIPAGTRNWTMQLEAEADGVYMIQLETETQVKQLRYLKQ